MIKSQKLPTSVESKLIKKYQCRDKGSGWRETNNILEVRK